MFDKKPVYVVRRDKDKRPTSLERVTRVIYTLRRVRGNFVRYGLFWRPVHEAKELGNVLDQMDLKAAGIVNLAALERLPFIDPSQDETPGDYPEAFR